VNIVDKVIDPFKQSRLTAKDVQLVSTVPVVFKMYFRIDRFFVYIDNGSGLETLATLFSHFPSTGPLAVSSTGSTSRVFIILTAVLWIRNYFFRIRIRIWIPFSAEFWIRIQKNSYGSGSGSY
jgi:hypothetical protein